MVILENSLQMLRGASMESDYKHYIPVLYWRQAEREALKDIGLFNGEIINRFTPLIQLYPKDFEGDEILIENKVAKIIDEINEYWGDERILLDPCLLPLEIQVTIVKIIEQNVYARKLMITPTTNLSKNFSYQTNIKSLVKRDQNGLCIRLHPTELIKPGFQQTLLGFLQSLEVPHNEVDLIIDFQFINEQSISYEYLAKQIPYIYDWRILAFIGGSFPKNLSGFPIDTHKIPRTHWNFWRDLLQNKNLKRFPCYGDYTVRHPIFEEVPDVCFPTASIFYTLDNEWLLMRGAQERSDGGKGYQQYIGNAMLLIENNGYRGPNFSKGDAYINEIGTQLQPNKTGNRRTWIQAGINHHIVQVVSQLADFDETSTFE